MNTSPPALSKLLFRVIAGIVPGVAPDRLWLKHSAASSERDSARARAWLNDATIDNSLRAELLRAAEGRNNNR